MEINNREAPPRETKTRDLDEEARASGSSAFLGADETGNKAKAAAAQARPTVRYLRDNDRLHHLGVPAPYVVIEFLPWETRVTLSRPVWSFADTSRVWLGSGRRSAERYANDLFERLCEAADSTGKYRKEKRPSGVLRAISMQLAKRERELRG